MGCYRVLLVCSGNTCRSPLAQMVLEGMLKEKGLAGKIEVTSRGICADAGRGASAGALLASQAKGLDLTHHVARRLLPEDVKTADIVFCMTVEQRDSLRIQYPRESGRIHALACFGRDTDGPDIQDPASGGYLDYISCLSQIEVEIKRIVLLLEKMVSQPHRRV